MKRLAEFFSLAERNTDLRTELVAGSLSFFAVFYTFIVDASLFEKIGISFGEAYMAQVLTFVIGNLVMAFLVRRPVVVSHNVALMTYFIFIIVLSEGVHYSEASGAAIVAALVFVILAFSRLGKKLLFAIPDNLRQALPMGLGALLVIFGLKFGKVLGVSPFRFAMTGDFSNPITFLSVMGLLVALILSVNKVKAALPLGMCITAIAAYCLGCLDLPLGLFMMPQGMERTVMGFSFSNIELHLVFSLVLFMTVFFETFAVIGISENEVADKKRCFQAASLSSLVSSFLGMLPMSCTVESMVAVQERGKTGMVPLTAALWGGFFLFCEPIARCFAEMPAITAPLLIVTGLKMLVSESGNKLWVVGCQADLTEVVPSLFMVLFMAFTFDITLGIGIGLVLQVLLKLFSGKRAEVSMGTYILTLIFGIYFINKVI